MPVRSAPIPALRGDLEFQRRRDGTVEIRDPFLLQILTVDSTDFGVATAFDGERALDAIAKDLAKTIVASRVEHVADQFDRLGLLDTPEVWTREPESDAVAPWGQMSSRAGLSVIPEAQPAARWDCHGCGACCHGLQVELTEAEDARIDRSRYHDLLGDEDYAEKVFLNPNEPVRRVLRQNNDDADSCIFLSKDGLCLIHARQGMEAKPDACQIFPLMVLRVPWRQPRLGVRINCQSMFLSFDDEDTPLSAHAAHALRVARREPVHAAPAKLDWFGTRIGFRDFDDRCRGITQILEPLGATPAAIRKIDRAYLDGRVAKVRRTYGKAVGEYTRGEIEGELTVGSGAYHDQLERLVLGQAAIVAMARGERPPELAPEIAGFFARQIQHVLYLCGPLNAPDAGYGTVALFLAVEAAMHAVGPGGTIDEANVALDVFTIPLLETLEHMWPILNAIDPDYASSLRKEMA